MGSFNSIFLAFDAVLMGVVVYMFVIQGRKQVKETHQCKNTGLKERKALDKLREKLDSELIAIRKTAARMEKKRLDFENYESVFNEKQRRLDKKLREAEKSVKDMNVLYQTESPDNVYTNAKRMMSLGIPVDEVCKRFALLDGEAEIISSLSSYKV